LMATQNPSELLDALRPALAAAAKNVLFHAYGADGLPWGTPFDDLEQLAAQVGQQLSRDILHHALQRQADSTPPAALQRCPACAQPLRHQPSQARLLDT